MQFYEIEMLTAPYSAWGLSVQTAHYHNTLGKRPRMLEIALVLEGRAIYTYPDGHTELVEPTMLVPVVNDMMCDIRAYENEFQRHDTVFIHAKYHAKRRDTADVEDYARIKQGIARGTLILLPYQAVLGEKFAVVQKQLRRMISLSAATNIGDQMRMLAEWYTLCAMLTEMVMEQLDRLHLNSPPSAIRYVQKAKDYISAHYREPLCVEDIASHLGVSSSYLYAMFKRVVSMGPLDYINRCRIEQACHLARNTSLSLNEISADIGIRDPSYMSRLFKRVMGVTFSEYRRNPEKHATLYDP